MIKLKQSFRENRVNWEYEALLSSYNILENHFGRASMHPLYVAAWRRGMQTEVIFRFSLESFQL